MPISSTRSGLLLVGSAAALRRAEPLRAAHAETGMVRGIRARRGATGWRRDLDGVDAVVLLTDAAVPVAEAVEATHLRAADGRWVPVGVMPDEPAAIAAAAAVRRRPAVAGPVVVLSSRGENVQTRVRELRTRMPAVAVADVPSGAVERRAVLGALAAGPGLVVYTGEGAVRGWQGYGGVQAWELARTDAAPIAALVSLSCLGSARWGSLRGLCETVVAAGGAAGAVGAVTEVPRRIDDALALRIAGRMAEGATRLADLLSPGAGEAPWGGLEAFRVSGDPLAPLLGTAAASAAFTALAAQASVPAP